MAKVFISYSSKDKQLARKIAIDLRRVGIDVWLDEWEIVVGQPIVQRVQEGLEGSQFVAVLLTKHSIKSGWVEKEWQSKIGEEAKHKRAVVLPLKADNCEIPLLLRDKKYADFARDYDSAMWDLISAIRVLAYNLIKGNRRKKKPIDQAALLSIASYDLITPSIQWLNNELSEKEWVLPLCSPKKKGLTLDTLLRKKIRKWDEQRRFPWGPMLELQPDIAGAIKLSHTHMYGWIIGMVYPNMMFEYDVIRSRFYIDAADAFLGYVFWDMENGFSSDGYRTLTTYGMPYFGITESGEVNGKMINYVMYSRRHNQFMDDLEGSLVVRMTLM